MIKKYFYQAEVITEFLYPFGPVVIRKTEVEYIRHHKNRIDQSEVHVKEFETRVKNLLKEKGITKIVAGISGGADSMAMLFSLISSGVEIVGVHCNFHLRGEESERDRIFVEKVCQRCGIRLEVVDFDVEGYRKIHGGSVEMACRTLRYDFFKKKMLEERADRIAVAHNSDDNAETLLLNLMRGSGVAGLGAIEPDTGEIIRPLLSFSRKSIEDYLYAKGESYVTDSTNLISDYRRNFIRNEVIPLLEREWPETKRSLNRTAAIMREEKKATEEIIRSELPLDLLPYDKLCNPASGRWWLHHFMVRRGGSVDIEEEIWRSVSKNSIQKGKYWKLSLGELIFGSEGLQFLREERLPEGSGLKEQFSITEYENSLEKMARIKTDRSNLRLWVSIDPGEIELRTRRAGDRIHPIGMKGSRLVSDVVAESKMNELQKRRLAVAEHKPSGRIIWVEGLKRSRYFLINESDRNIYAIERKENFNSYD